MKLRAKIKPKYLDDILSGQKDREYRQFESMVLTDANGRSAEFDINGISRMPNFISKNCIMDEYNDVPWDDRKDIYEIVLGCRIIQEGDE